MKRTRKLVTVAVLAVAVVVSAITAAYALSANTTETYAYLPEHSVYFYDTAGEYAWASSEVDTLAVAGVIKGGGTHLFYPGNAITRADFIVMLDRAYGMSLSLIHILHGSNTGRPAGYCAGCAVRPLHRFRCRTGKPVRRCRPASPAAQPRQSSSTPVSYTYLGSAG